ncbi:cob(I)yrinic acid a c-diamide adenosyltransferase [Sphingomonas sp. Leaf412]|uniref:cob(I)yrinic acid a,c-diamide adenosyltransferase n=1 Tax=Sphingomonas sp. Leaf412 TaxID=1736370 RepID=UPI0006F7F5BE|nr:cob(I)yrinic acid a,c-diamide adenosyltransferase [Sphingomonas sp. Leaf412]KQT33341.1 cob(I)yrinic acid a c-diamide adenosyltransferase [Sphingomonas sp. Leaf412]
MVKLTKIYTRTGDGGTTGLVDGSRVSKSDSRVAAIGDVDELNSALGVAIASLHGGDVLHSLSRVQNDLFDLGADLATPGDDFTPSDMTLRIVASQVNRLEQDIDAMNATLDPLASFILPGGDAAHLHLARAIARRAERAVAAMGATANPNALIYLNRLSDFLFVACRYVNKSGGGDVLWVPGAMR